MILGNFHGLEIGIIPRIYDEIDNYFNFNKIITMDEYIEEIIIYNPENINNVDYYENPPIFYAIDKKCYKLFDKILTYNPDLNIINFLCDDIFTFTISKNYKPIDYYFFSSLKKLGHFNNLNKDIIAWYSFNFRYFSEATDLESIKTITEFLETTKQYHNIILNDIQPYFTDDKTFIDNILFYGFGVLCSELIKIILKYIPKIYDMRIYIESYFIEYSTLQGNDLFDDIGIIIEYDFNNKYYKINKWYEIFKNIDYMKYLKNIADNISDDGNFIYFKYDINHVQYMLNYCPYKITREIFIKSIPKNKYYDLRKCKKTYYYKRIFENIGYFNYKNIKFIKISKFIEIFKFF